MGRLAAGSRARTLRLRFWRIDGSGTVASESLGGRQVLRRHRRIVVLDFPGNRLGPWLGRSVLRPLVEVAFGYAKWKYKLDFEKASPDRAIASSHVPVLLIHGELDSNIPVRHSRMIAKDDPEVSLWVVPGAEHCGAISIAPREFEQLVVGWYGRHLVERSVAVAVTSSSNSSDRKERDAQRRTRRKK